MSLLSLALGTLHASSLVAAAAYPRAASFTPTLTDTFIYDLDNVPIPAPTVTSKTGVKVNAHVYIVDGAEHTSAQIAKYKSSGKAVMCYFSAGSWEPSRDDALSFPPECYCGAGISYDSKTGKCQGTNANQNKLDGWDEWWLDIHNPTCLSKIQALQTKRIQSFVAKGCDGIDPDNVDAYSNKQKFGITAQDQVNYLLWLSQTARTNNLVIDLKNAGGLLVDGNGKATQWQSSLVKAFDFNVIESCNQYTECNTYDSFLAAGKPQIQIEYITDDYSLTKCPSLKQGQHLLVYNQDSLDTTQITLQCSDSA